MVCALSRAGLGKKKAQKERVEWHEIKTGVFHLQEQAARTEGGRGLIADKRVVRCMAQAQDKVVLGDGIPWIWNLKTQRWADAHELLNF
jgi:hypothetical protein